MQTNQPSLASVTLIYIGFFLAMSVLLNLILWAAETFAGFTIESSAVGWMPLILGAMMTGQNYGQKTGAKPSQGYAWMAGLIFMLVSVVLSVAVLYVVALVMNFDLNFAVDELRREAGNDGPLIAGIIGGVLLLIWVLQRFIFSVGAGQGAKLAAKGK